jgi:O-antigen ligase
MGRLSIGMALIARAIPSMPSGVPLGMLILPAAIIGGVVAVPLVGTSMPVETLALAVIVGAFVFALNSRAWLAVPPLIVDLSISDIWLDPLGMSLRFAVTVVAVAFTAATLIGTDMTSLREQATQRVMLTTCIFMAVCTVVNLLFSDLGYVVKYLRYQLTLTAPLFLLLLLLRDRPAIRTIFLAALTVAVVSGLLAIAQRFGGPDALYATSDGLPRGEMRASGLSGSPVMLANGLLSVGMTGLAFLAVVWSPRVQRRYLLLLATGVVLAGMYLSTTRSAILGLAAGMAIVLLFVDARRRQHLCGVLVFGALIAGIALMTGAVDDRLSSGAEEDTSAATHIAVGQVAVSLTLDNALLGVGHANFLSASRAYVDEVDVGVGGRTQLVGERIIGQIRAHNDFLEVWSSWGITGLLSYVLVLVSVLINCYLASQSQDRVVRALGIGCAAGLISYLVNSFFHNYLDSTIVLWVYAGLSAVLVQLSVRAKDRISLLRGIRPPTHVASRFASPALQTGGSA